MDKESQARAIVIAGMHRSGTSALSRTLNLVGCEMSEVLVGGDQRGNERGHWESQRINELNNEILASAGSRWDDWEAINPSWYASPLYAKYFEQARETLKLEFPTAPLYVIKDPRFCRLMDLWLKVIKSLDAQPLVVMPIRSPQDVAASLLTRDNIDPSIGRLLWLRHVLDAEAGSRHCQRVTVRFEDLLNDWQSVVVRIGEELQLSWPRISSASSLEVESFLTPDLHHHADPRTSVEPDTQSVRWIAECHEILQRWSAGEQRDSDWATLDEIRSGLNALGPLFGRPILLGRNAMRDVRILEGNQAELTDLLEAETTRTDELRGTVAEQETKLREMAAQHEAAVEALHQSEAKQAAEVALQRTEVTQLRNEVAERDQTLAERDQTLAERDQEILERDQEILERDQKIVEQNQKIDGQHGKLASLSDTLANTQSQIGTLMQAVNERDQTLAERDQEILERDQEILERDQKIVEQNQKIDGQHGKLASLSDTLANTQSQIGILMQAVNERDQRIATLLQSSSWRLTAPLRKFTLALSWLLRKAFRLAQISGWLVTGQFRKAAQSALPFYRRHAPRWVGALIPRRVRHWLRASTTPAPNVKAQPSLDSGESSLLEVAQFVPEHRGAPPPSSGVRLIAFYLPQFHSIPENDAWWGEGFTEWTNVRTATPQFSGHYQPRVPIDAGYYDLREPDVQRRQVELAKRHGIGGFCFYFYWFAGRRLLETPLLNYLNDNTLDLPFCLCWANENWTRRWDGREQDLLIGQEHSAEDDLRFIEYVSLYLKDSRYIRIDGRPLLLVYRPALFPDPAATVARWREWCRANGIGELYIAMVQSFQDLDPRPYGIDAAVEFPWHTGLPTDVTAHLVPAKSEFRGHVFDWEDYATKCEDQPDQPWTQMRGVMPGWDNTPRRKSEAHLFQGHTPAGYGRWLRSALRWTLARNRSAEERLLFINAWNEWGEGAYLEPDHRFGYAFLNATRTAVEEVAREPADSAHPHPTSTAGFEVGALALASKQIAAIGPSYRASPDGIRFPSPMEPQVSVVIPVHGKCDLTLRCLKSLRDSGTGRSFEVIVVDDASPDESGQTLSTIAGIRYLRNDRNLGFLQSCNRGAALARGHYILLLNNDTMVESGAIDALADTFNSHHNVGLVGAKLYFEDGSLQEAGGIVFADGSAANFGRGDDPRKPEYNYVRDVDYCSGAAIMLPSTLWRQLGGFDNYYERAYYEDTDLAFRVRQAGYRTLYQPFAKIIHSEGATSGTDPSKGEKRYQTENQVRFLERWRDTLELGHAAPSTPPELAKDRGVAGHLLIIDWATPMADHDSGSVDTVNLVRMLGRLGMKTVFAAHRDLDYRGSYTDNLQRLGAEVLYAPHWPSIGAYLNAHGEELEHVIVHRVGVFKDLASDLKRLCPNARIVFNTVDLHHLREERQAAVEQSDRLKRQAQATRKTEIELARRSDAIVVVSDHEKVLLQEAVPNKPVFHLPLTRDIPGAGAADFSQRHGIAFLGNYLHPPNIDAVLHFVQQVWPALHAKMPSVELLVGGAQMTAEVEELGLASGVRTIGYVEDLADFFGRIRLTIAPLRYGAGAKGKVISSLCHGIPTVASPIAAEGLNLKEGREILIAESAEDWVTHLQSAYCNEQVWRDLSSNGLKAMHRSHSLEAGAKALKQILGLDEVGDVDVRKGQLSSTAA